MQASLSAILTDPTIPWQKIILGAGYAVFLIETFISGRQRPFLSRLLAPTVPSSLVPYLKSSSADQLKTYHASQDYARDKINVGVVLSLLDQVESFALLTGVVAVLYNGMGSASVDKPDLYVEAAVFSSTKNWTLLKGFWDEGGKLPYVTGEITQSIAFVLLLSTLGTFLSVPKAYYKCFYTEQQHGFNRTSHKTFFLDHAKTYILTILIETPAIAALLWIIRYVGPSGMVTVVGAMMLFIFALQIIMVPLYPLVILPLFNTLTPLDTKSPVYPLVQDLAKKLSFPLGKILVIDGSTRSNHSNAFFIGLPFLTKSIVIYDTLLATATPQEIEAILAHELGHWKGNHVVFLLLSGLSQIALSLTTFVLFLNNAPLLAAFGFPADPISASNGPVIISLFLAANLFSPMSAILHCLSNTLTRHLEYNADAFAVKLGKSYAVNLKGALVKIHEKNLAIYGVDPIYSAYHHNHPTLIERLENLDAGLGIKQEAKKDL